MPNHPSNRVETMEQIEALFTYHAPQGDQPERYEKINAAAKALALVILECCPGCADRTDALRKLREVRMVANASVACEPQDAP